MAPTPAVELLLRSGLSHRVHAYEHDPATPSFGLEAAEALDVDAVRVFKTLIVEADAQLVVGIVPVTSGLDLKALAKAVGAKRATMATPSSAERSSGYVVGGISPLAQKRRLPTVLDESATSLSAIFVSAGRRGLEVELAPSALIALTGAQVAAIARRS